MKILVATKKAFAPVAVEQIREITENAGYELILLENYKSSNHLLSAVRDADAMIVRSDRVTADVIGAGSRLKIVVRAGAGYDNLDLEACSEHNVVAMNTPGQNSNAVAELVFEMMLFNSRKGFSGKWGTELRGKTIGIHGFGNIGKYVAKIAEGFGMERYAFDPFVPADLIRSYGVKVCEKADDLYAKCRYITLHLPASDKTRKSVGIDLLKLMPYDAVLINTSRKEIINERDLVTIFEMRSDISYLADVEPDCSKIFEEKFKKRFLFTRKKMGAQTEEANINAGVAAARQIVEYFKNGNEKFRLNK
jgi:D-3-phosphoglycerate dehydrogenase